VVVDEDGSVLELQMLTHCSARRAHSSSGRSTIGLRPCVRPDGRTALARLSPCPAAGPSSAGAVHYKLSDYSQFSGVGSAAARPSAIKNDRRYPICFPTKSVVRRLVVQQLGPVFFDAALRDYYSTLARVVHTVLSCVRKITSIYRSE